MEILTSRGEAARGRIRAVVFDLDGVLVDSLAVAREAFRLAYAEVVGAGEAPVDAYCGHPGRALPDVLRLLGLPAAMAQPFVLHSYRLAHLIRPMPGVPELLAALGDLDVALAVATGKDGARARALLDQLGLRASLAHVLGADDVARPKPAPDILLEALRLLDVEPDAAVMVGDAAADLACARAAGVTGAAALWGESDRATLLAAGPDLVLAGPDDLLQLWPGQRRS